MWPFLSSPCLSPLAAFSFPPFSLSLPRTSCCSVPVGHSLTCLLLFPPPLPPSLPCSPSFPLSPHLLEQLLHGPYCCHLIILCRSRGSTPPFSLVFFLPPVSATPLFPSPLLGIKLRDKSWGVIFSRAPQEVKTVPTRRICRGSSFLTWQGDTSCRASFQIGRKKKVIHFLPSSLCRWICQCLSGVRRWRTSRVRTRARLSHGPRVRAQPHPSCEPPGTPRCPGTVWSRGCSTWRRGTCPPCSTSPSSSGTQSAGRSSPNGPWRYDTLSCSSFSVPRPSPTVLDGLCHHGNCDADVSHLFSLQVCCECGCDETVFPLSVSLLDRFLSASLSIPVSPYCLAAGCILIASKLTECDNVTADTLCAAAEYSFHPSNLRVSRSLSKDIVPNHLLLVFWGSFQALGPSYHHHLAVA